MSETLACPYCRMPFDEQGPPKIFCTACGMPHHEDCYQENGGCTVFGCPRAPADDPKLQVSYSDLQAAPLVAPQAAATTLLNPAAPSLPSAYGGPLGLSRPAVASVGPAPTQPGPAQDRNQAPPGTGYPYTPRVAQQRQQKSRTTYIVLGVVLGAFGAHNFYAGYTGRAVGQLCLSVLTLFYLAAASWLWAIVEICIVEKDSAGIQFS